MSQAELSQISGVSDRTISSIEQGTSTYSPKPETIVKLAIATGADPFEWQELCDEPGALDAESIEALRSKIRSPNPYVPADDLRKYTDEQVEKVEEQVKEDLEKFEPAATLREDYMQRIEAVKNDVKQLIEDGRWIPAEDLSKIISSELSDKIKPAEKIEAEFKQIVEERSRDVERRLQAMEGRMEDSRKLLDEVRERLNLLSVFCQGLSRQLNSSGGALNKDETL